MSWVTRRVQFTSSAPMARLAAIEVTRGVSHFRCWCWMRCWQITILGPSIVGSMWAWCRRPAILYSVVDESLSAVGWTSGILVRGMGSLWPRHVERRAYCRGVRDEQHDLGPPGRRVLQVVRSVWSEGGSSVVAEWFHYRRSRRRTGAPSAPPGGNCI